jgi:hypothetical protein
MTLVKDSSIWVMLEVAFLAVWSGWPPCCSVASDTDCLGSIGATWACDVQLAWSLSYFAWCTRVPKTCRCLIPSGSRWGNSLYIGWQVPAKKKRRELIVYYPFTYKHRKILDKKTHYTTDTDWVLLCRHRNLYLWMDFKNSCKIIKDKGGLYLNQIGPKIKKWEKKTYIQRGPKEISLVLVVADETRIQRESGAYICVRWASCSPRIMQMLRAPAAQGARSKGCYFGTPLYFETTLLSNSFN